MASARFTLWPFSHFSTSSTLWVITVGHGSSLATRRAQDGEELCLSHNWIQGDKATCTAWTAGRGMAIGS